MVQSDGHESHGSSSLLHEAGIELHRISIADSIRSSDHEHLLGTGYSESNESLTEALEVRLPPQDVGRQAWTFLVSIWLLEAMIWGFPLSFGIFQAYYSNYTPFKDERSGIPTIGALVIGVSYLGCPFVNPVVFKLARYQKSIIVMGWLLCASALVLASFATHVWHLWITQGAMYGASWVLCYTPFLIMLNDWFVKKRGLAIGILFGASGVAGLVLPFILEALLGRYGFRITLRVYGAAIVIIGGPGLLYLRTRAPPSETAAPKTDYTFMRNQHFWFFAAAIMFQGLGFFLPNTFLPSFADALGLSKTHGDLLLAMTALAQVSGQMAMGYFSDKFNAYIPITVSVLIQAAAVLVLWGPAKGFGRLAAFAASWGFSAGSYSVLYTSAATTLTKSGGEMMTLYALFSFERGVANIMEGPIAALLLGNYEEESITLYGLGKYSKIVWFVGIMMLLSSAGGTGYFVKKWGRGEKQLLGKEEIPLQNPGESGETTESYHLVQPASEERLESAASLHVG